MGTFKENLKKYADVIVSVGVNIQKDQLLTISAQIDHVDLVRALVKSGYEHGAKEVIVRYVDEQVARMTYDYAPMESFENFPEWLAEFNNGYAKKNAAQISITGNDPDLMKGIDTKKQMAQSMSAYKACKPMYDMLDMNINTWCIAAAPTVAWAKKVFPNEQDDEKAVERLWNAIFKATRIDTKDPVAEWEKHCEEVQARTKWINDSKFEALHYTNSIGTDIVVGLPKNYKFGGAGGTTQGGVYYVPNMPTEEIFASPDKLKVNGTVKSAMPLNHGGTLIDNFSITFKDGRAVEWSAEVGEDMLNAIIETDEGSHYLGECALIPNDSPISNTGILFYNTLFDENASCHFALGKGFPECFEGGLEMTEEQLAECGMNNSAKHVDFMLGTKDLNIMGIKDGKEIPIFKNGNWA